MIIVAKRTQDCPTGGGAPIFNISDLQPQKPVRSIINIINISTRTFHFHYFL
jgi:hypothetical protein